MAELVEAKATAISLRQHKQDWNPLKDFAGFHSEKFVSDNGVKNFLPECHASPTHNITVTWAQEDWSLLCRWQENGQH